VTYDQLFRTVKDMDVANLTDTTTWDPVKDLVLATTDEAGLKTTSLYDDDDRAISQYGPAPAAWFGANRQPLSAYVSQVPHSDTAYDEGLTGPSVAYYGYAPSSQSLSGPPKLHSTNLAGTSPAEINRYFGASSPIPGVSTDWGFRATGKLRLPAAGSYSFRVWSDNGLRLWIDDQLLLDDWNDGGQRNHPLVSYQNTANSLHRFRLDYYHRSGDANLTMYLTPPGQSETQTVAQYFKPDYDLTTSAKTYDGQIGDVTTTTNYGPNPELGLAQSSTVDPGGLNLTTSSSYETQGAAGSFLRQTKQQLPGNPATNPAFSYSYYGATETRDNPCT
jgi:hypothetical protein